MDNTVYALLAGNIGEHNRAKMVSNNVANAQTDGYKRDDMLFTNYLTKDVQDTLALPQDRSTMVNLAQGAPNQTKHYLDFALSGRGFFMVQTPQGVRYTRQSHYYRNSENVITTAQGYPLLSVEGVPLEMNEGDVDLLVSADGEVFGRYYDGDSQSAPLRQELRGRIAVVDFADPHQLRKVAATLFTTEQQAVEATECRIIQGAVEESNVNPIGEMTQMVDLQKRVDNDGALISKMYSMQSKAYEALAVQPK